MLLLDDNYIIGYFVVLVISQKPFSESMRSVHVRCVPGETNVAARAKRRLCDM